MAYEVTEYFVTDAAQGSGSGVDDTEANALTLEEGLLKTATAGNVDVYIKLGDYSKANTSYEIAGDGSIAGNKHLRLIGYNTNKGDMNFINPNTGVAGLFHQSALSAHVIGPIAGKKVILAGSGTDHTILDMGDAINTTVQNFSITSTGDDCIDADSTVGSCICDCVFPSGEDAISVLSSKNLRVFGNFAETDLGTAGASAEAALYEGNIWNCAVAGISYPNKGATIYGNIFVGGTHGVQNARRCFAFNNMFYGQATAGISTNSNSLTQLTEYNNIFCLLALDDYAVLMPTGVGSLVYSDYSLAHAIAAGDFSVAPWYGTDGTEDLIGPNSQINVDPLLLAPAAKNYMPHPDSPCWNRGKPGPFGVRSHIGPFTREIDPRWRGRRYMYG